jgi:DNA-binding MarR family transcriptional regulator
MPVSAARQQLIRRRIMRILRYTILYIRRNGRPATEREIGAALGIPYSTVHSDWERLEARGLVTRAYHDARRGVIPTVLAGFCPVCGRSKE